MKEHEKQGPGNHAGPDTPERASILRSFEPFTEAITEKIWRLPIPFEQRANIAITVSGLIVGNIAGRFASQHFTESLFAAAQTAAPDQDRTEDPANPNTRQKGTGDDASK